MKHLNVPNESAEYRAARQVPQVAPFYPVTRSPLARLEAWARERRWPHLRFLSAAGNSYTSDYFGNTAA